MEPSKPLVTVFLLHHLAENRPYLDLAIQGLQQQKGVPFEVILLSDVGVQEYGSIPGLNITAYEDSDLDTATKKVKMGIELAHPDSLYYFIHSDDVILGPECLTNLVMGNMRQDRILNPISNGENGSRFLTDFGFPQSASLEEVAGILHLILKQESPWKDKELLVRQDWVSFYATLIPKKVWELVGGLDPELETRHNDQLFCMQAATHGIASYLDFTAFAWHFGSRTLSKSVKPGEQDAATRHFSTKVRQLYGI